MCVWKSICFCALKYELFWFNVILNGFSNCTWVGFGLHVSPKGFPPGSVFKHWFDAIWAHNERRSKTSAWAQKSLFLAILLLQTQTQIQIQIQMLLLIIYGHKSLPQKPPAPNKSTLFTGEKHALAIPLTMPTRTFYYHPTFPFIFLFLLKLFFVFQKTFWLCSTSSASSEFGRSEQASQLESCSFHQVCIFLCSISFINCAFIWFSIN